MAVVLGTNAGFVETAPVADPGGTTTAIDYRSVAIKDTSPVGTNKITEIGWWCDNATEETNFEVGLYSHHVGNDKPDVRLFVNATNAKGTGAGWKTVAVDWALDAETIYWIAIQVDNTVTTTNIDRNTDGTRISIKSTIGGLLDPWSGASTETIWARAVYAVWEVAATYSELSGTGAGVGAGSGDLELNTYSALAGTCAGAGDGSGDLGSTLVHVASHNAYKRLVVAGNNEIWYEDI